MPTFTFRLTEEERKTLEEAAEGQRLGKYVKEAALQKAEGLSNPRVAFPNPSSSKDFVRPLEDDWVPPPKKPGCAICGEQAGQLHKKSCYLGGTVTA